MVLDDIKSEYPSNSYRDESWTGNVIPKVVFRPSKLWKFLGMLFHLQFYPDKTLEVAAFHCSLKIRVWKLELELHWVAVIPTSGYIYQASLKLIACVEYCCGHSPASPSPSVIVGNPASDLRLRAILNRTGQFKPRKF
ncbi:hypothetical protein FRX31_014551 [Thalictrum thalictroides]|uniref:Uncharacterized protein n=1 Tax=Thalictrum thalictroides TaxID=46969 RepID=A0A7J6WFY2_THATH|nr:hypothetical protein FRX31_014551 [Thalictrum thalictroides]